MAGVFHGQLVLNFRVPLSLYVNLLLLDAIFHFSISSISSGHIKVTRRIAYESVRPKLGGQAGHAFVAIALQVPEELLELLTGVEGRVVRAIDQAAPTRADRLLPAGESGIP